MNKKENLKIKNKVINPTAIENQKDICLTPEDILSELKFSESGFSKEIPFSQSPPYMDFPFSEFPNYAHGPYTGK